MALKQWCTGLQHIGIPTNDIEQTISFYQSLGFEVALRTLNAAVNEAVAFLQLGDLMIETYQNGMAVGMHGAIDHIAINVSDVDKAWAAVCELGLEPVEKEIQALPFWENGVRFFNIIGPNGEKLEFSQRI